MTEIACIVPNKRQFPAIYLFSGAARFIRPVKNVKTQQTEMIGESSLLLIVLLLLTPSGSFEQPYLMVSVRPNEITASSTHVELAPVNMFSILASLTPFSDYNQSPRNMYQCQMAKQTMGTPLHSLPYRSDNKLYRIQSPQTPIVRNFAHDNYHLDEYLTGCNAVVAVLAYTGYDMEDAMIINKSSYERGFGNGYVYKTDFIDLTEESKGGEDVQYFDNVLVKDGESSLVCEVLEVRLTLLLSPSHSLSRRTACHQSAFMSSLVTLFMSSGTMRRRSTPS